MNSGSRSWIRKRLPLRQPSLVSVTLRLTWLIHAASGSDAIPAISTRRVESSMMKSTANRVSPRPVQTLMVKKSVAARTSQCVFKNSVQVVFFTRSGAGSRPCSRRTVAIVTSGDVVIEVGQGALDPCVAPAAVVRGHPHDQRADLGHDGRSSGTTMCPPVVLLGDQGPVPRQQRVRRHNRGDVPQHAPFECLGFRRQSSALRVGEPDTSGPELFPQHAVLLLKIIDDIALLLVHPTGERDENKPQRVRHRGHGVKATRGSVHRLRGARQIPESRPLPNRHSVCKERRRSDCWTLRAQHARGL